MSGDEGAGKGDDPRPVDKKKYDETLDRVFGERDPLEYHKDKPGKKGHDSKNKAP